MLTGASLNMRHRRIFDRLRRRRMSSRRQHNPAKGYLTDFGVSRTSSRLPMGRPLFSVGSFFYVVINLFILPDNNPSGFVGGGLLNHLPLHKGGTPPVAANGRSRVSLRLGPLAALTVHWTVIHYRSCRFATPAPTKRHRRIFDRLGRKATVA